MRPNWYDDDERPQRRRVQFGPGLLSPFIKVMLLVNGGVFVLQYIWPQLTGIAGLSPARFFADFPNLLYQPFTYMFLHGGFFHLFFNMFALWMFGTEIETTWGTRRFAKFYLLAGLAGALLVLMVNYDQPQPVIGASGAIAGVLGAYILLYPKRPVRVLMFITIIRLPAVVVIGAWFILQLMSSLAIFSGTAETGGIAYLAHVGGFVTGFLMTFIFR